MKFGVSSYSFLRLVKEGSMKQTDVVRKAAEMGFDFIEFAVLQIPEGKAEIAFFEELRNECEKHGIPALVYAFGADFLNGYAGGSAEDEVKRVQAQVDLAGILGCSLIRHDVANRPPADSRHKSFYQFVPKLAKAIREVSEYAGQRNIRTTVENHGYFAQDSDRIEQLIMAVDNENFGALVDMGNFACVGEDSARAVGRLAPYALHVHAKDMQIKPADADPGRGWMQSGPRGCPYLKGTIIGHGDIPVYTCLKALNFAGYQGAVSIEFEGIEEPLTGIEIGFENLKRYAARAGY